MEQMGLFTLIGGLLIFTLLMASLVRRYQEHMAIKRMRLQRIIRGVDAIEQMLEQNAGCTLPAEIERLLREDVVFRLQLVRRIDRRFQGIDSLIEEAELIVNQPRSGQKQVVLDHHQLQKVNAALGQLMGFLTEGRLQKPLTPEQVRSYVEQLGTLRAECVYGYHSERADQSMQADKLEDALADYKSIKSFLSEYGPDNEQVRAWYAEAEELCKAVIEKIAADG